jgi:hypothetical protein
MLIGALRDFYTRDCKLCSPDSGDVRDYKIAFSGSKFGTSPGLLTGEKNLVLVPVIIVDAAKDLVYYALLSSIYS